MVQLVEFKDVSVFKEYCLDRLAVGINPEMIASDVSIFVGHQVPVEQILSSNSDLEIEARRKELLKEVKESAPVVSRELFSVLAKIKNFVEKADKAFESSEMGDSLVENFDAYRRAMELQLKALDVANKQLSLLSEVNARPNVVNITFNVDDLRRLESSGAVKIVDIDLAGDLLGTKE